MARKSVIEKNERKKRQVLTGQERREELKKVLKNTSLPIEVRFEAQNKLAQLPRNTSKSRVRNRCTITGRGRGYLRYFKMSRLMMRHYASFGAIPGLSKASW